MPQEASFGNGSRGSDGVFDRAAKRPHALNRRDRYEHQSQVAMTNPRVIQFALRYEF